MALAAVAAGLAAEGHLARFVVDIVEQLDPSELPPDYRRAGKRGLEAQPWEPD